MLRLSIVSHIIFLKDIVIYAGKRIAVMTIQVLIIAASGLSCGG